MRVDGPVCSGRGRFSAPSGAACLVAWLCLASASRARRTRVPGLNPPGDGLREPAPIACFKKLHPGNIARDLPNPPCPGAEELQIARQRLTDHVAESFFGGLDRFVFEQRSNQGVKDVESLLDFGIWINHPGVAHVR